MICVWNGCLFGKALQGAIETNGAGVKDEDAFKRGRDLVGLVGRYPQTCALLDYSVINFDQLGFRNRIKCRARLIHE